MSTRFSRFLVKQLQLHGFPMDFWIHDGFLHSQLALGFTMGCWIDDRSLDSRWVLGFTMGSWIHDRFLDSRWDPGFTIGFWIHDGFLDSRLANGCSTLREAEDLMRIMSSEPRLWMVFGQLVMPVQCCAEARRRRVPQHSTAQA